AYEWPKNTKREYVALLSLWIGGEVVDESGNTIRIVDLPAFRSNPASGADWNVLPVPGYFNDKAAGGGKIAKSDDPGTWPSFWPDKIDDAVDPGWKGKWNGFFGKNQFNADQEMFYRVGDDNYDRYNYVPDTTDRSRRGLGLIVDTRVLQWSQVSVADAVFFIHEFKNDGTKDIKKVGTTIWLADLVGGDGDSQDDTPDFDLRLAVAFSLDKDGRSSNPFFQGTFVGAVATSFLETPGNAQDRIDNDGDSPENPQTGGGPPVTLSMIAGEISGDQVDNNGNGLIDEDSTYVAFGTQKAATFADGIDNNDNGEAGSPVVTQQMVNQAASDPWNRWPPNPESDSFMTRLDGKPIIHLIGLGPEDVGKRFKDNVDNDGSSYGNWPTVTQTMIDQAATDPYNRYRVSGTNIVLYNLTSALLGKKYLNVDGARDAGIDEKIDEMIDESRDDGIDNNGDWNPVADDVGLDGAAGTGDPGEGDGRPTSGAGTQFPGEPHIDKTDIKEADMIGLTNVQYKVAGGINFNTTADIVYWADFMTPGKFVDPAEIKAAGPGDYDLFVSSGFFPLLAGQTERVSYSAVFGNAVQAGDPDASGAKADALRKRVTAQLAYNENYQFAQVPIEPNLTAVAGPRIVDGRRISTKPQVTLYWGDRAERSEDRFLGGIGADARDFEGYRIYRSTDPAFQDAKLITDGQGNPAPFLKPIAQFDLKDGIKGFSAQAYNGVLFYLGDDTGLQHTWTDTTVQLGQKYYYAIRAYDKGYLPLNITPSESNIRINIDNTTGEVRDVGPSVAIVTPEAPAAGYVEPGVTDIVHVAGTTTSTIGYNMVDASRMRDRRYRVTFEDTVLAGAGAAFDTFTTKTVTLADITASGVVDTLIARSRAVADTVDQPVVNGFRLLLKNQSTFALDQANSRWSRPGVFPFIWEKWANGSFIGQTFPNDYMVVFGPAGIDTSVAVRIAANITPRVVPINFKVYNTYDNTPVGVSFAERELTGGAGRLTCAYDSNFQGGNKNDWAVLVERNKAGNQVLTWWFALTFDPTKGNPAEGDTLYIRTSKLFRSHDVFEFTTHAQTIDPALAKSGLDKIKVVPNPYIAAATWEGANPFASGRGPRSLHFTHLPQSCTIRIYTVSGELVTVISHEGTALDGTAEWNLLTRDALPAAYGIYIYHIDAPGVGEKVGKFAVIK
ncbi:MAG: hypothetical protein AB1428_06345, partial [Bacteroidota bacterium]